MVRFASFQRTTEVLTKLLPVMVRVKLLPPAGAAEGLIAVTVGTGLVATGFIVKASAFEVVPPCPVVLITATEAVPGVAIKV